MGLVSFYIKIEKVKFGKKEKLCYNKEIELLKKLDIWGDRKVKWKEY